MLGKKHSYLKFIGTRLILGLIIASCQEQDKTSEVRKKSNQMDFAKTSNQMDFAKTSKKPIRKSSFFLETEEKTITLTLNINQTIEEEVNFIYEDYAKDEDEQTTEVSLSKSEEPISTQFQWGEGFYLKLNKQPENYTCRIKEPLKAKLQRILKVKKKCFF